MKQTGKLVLCGTNYGASYLPAIEESPYELAGIIALGSERSIRLATTKNVPLWSKVEDIPQSAGVTAAVVALPPSAAAEVTRGLLCRGIHVLLEHPVTAELLRDLREQAASSSATLHVNCHLAELSAARIFIAECRKRLATSPAQWITVTMAARSAFATFDLLGRAVGDLRTTTLRRESLRDGHPFATFIGRVTEIPLRVQCSGATATVDDGSDSPVPVRIEVGFDNGQLVLGGLCGPVLWFETFRVGLRDHPGGLWLDLGAAAMSFEELMRGDRKKANRRSLEELAHRVAGASEPEHQSTAWLSTVADLMRTVRTAPESAHLAAELEQ